MRVENAHAELMKDLTLKETEQLLPSSHALWNLVNGEISKRPKQDQTRFFKMADSFQMSGDMPQTKFVMEVARLAKAQKMGADEQTLNAIQDRIRKTAEQIDITDAEVYQRAMDPKFDYAMNIIPHADQFIELINAQIAPKDFLGVTQVAHDYIVAMGAYRSALDAKDEKGQIETWAKVEAMNKDLGIENNALVQSVKTKYTKPRSPMGLKQSRSHAKRTNELYGT
jgi:hypothetical protein